mgnify:CR=1 FL=1
MGTVVSYFEHKRRAGRARGRQIDPVMVEILEALHALGGCAHRQAVADEIALRRSARPGSADAAARNDIYAAFDAYVTRTASRKVPALLWRPLGPDSYRWALTDAGQRLLQPAPPAARMVR